MKEKIEGNVLVYTRRIFRQFFHGVTTRTFAGRIDYCSDWPGLESNYIMPMFYQYFKNNIECRDLNEYAINEIIIRCRVLRLLSPEYASKMINAMCLTVNDLLERYKPDYFFGLAVDNYILDIFVRVCRKKGIRVVQIMDGSIENTILCLSYGEYNKIRDPSEDEIKKALSSLLNESNHYTYGKRSDKYSVSRHLENWLKWYAKLIIFKAMRVIYKDPLNYRFLSAFLKIEMGITSVRNFRISIHFDHDWEQKISQANKPLLYIPLGFTPEASTDYWLKDLRYVDYENFVINLCHILVQKYVVVVKDHWAMMGLRWGRFYENLKSIPNIILVPPHANGRLLLRQIERVIVGSGTAGIEGAVRGNRVVTLCFPYYYLDGYYLAVESADQVSFLPDMIENFQPPRLTKIRQYDLVRRMLEPTLIGNVRVNQELNTVENWNITSYSLKSYLNDID